MAEVRHDLDEFVAKLPGTRRAINRIAKRQARKAEAVLRAHRHEGHARITVTQGKVDSFISLDDTRGQRAAAAIEYGRSGGRRGATQGIYALRAAMS